MKAFKGTHTKLHRHRLMFLVRSTEVTPPPRTGPRPTLDAARWHPDVPCSEIKPYTALPENIAVRHYWVLRPERQRGSRISITTFISPETSHVATALFSLYLASFTSLQFLRARFHQRICPYSTPTTQTVYALLYSFTVPDRRPRTP